MERIQVLFEKAKTHYNNGDPGHDLAHIRRVMQTCRKLGTSDGADVEVTLAGAILHDLVNLPKNHPERQQASRMAAEKAQDLLRDSGYSDAETERIGTVIIEHSYSLGKKPSSIESAVLQDADRIDAIGAIGVMRAVSCGAALGSSYYDFNDPFALNRELNDKAFTIDHFFTKLLKLPELMNTPAGRAEATGRAQFMTAFLSQLKTEVDQSILKVQSGPA